MKVELKLDAVTLPLFRNMVKAYIRAAEDCGTGAQRKKAAALKKALSDSGIE